MGCGSSKSAVVVIATEPPKSVTSERKVLVENEKEEILNENIEVDQPEKTNTILVKNAFEDVEEIEDDDVNTLSSRNSLKIQESKVEVVQTRDKSATSSRSMADSGVFDENVRNTSGRSQRSLPPLPAIESERKNSDKNSEKPPSGKKSSARKKLLRIEDDMIDSSLSINQPDSNSPPPAQEPYTTHTEHDPKTGQNMAYRPKSRFGNLAFDIVLDTPETGNARRKPEKLPPLVTKQRRTKKRKTKKDLEKKQEEAAARRKIQEEEKLLKAKQFQHFSICTQVEPFKLDEDEEGEDEAGTTRVSRIHSAGTASLHSNPLPNTNDSSAVEMNNNTVRPPIQGISPPSRNGSGKASLRNETIVEPFQLSDEEDEDIIRNNSFTKKTPLATTVAAC